MKKIFQIGIVFISIFLLVNTVNAFTYQAYLTYTQPQEHLNEVTEQFIKIVESQKFKRFKDSVLVRLPNGVEISLRENLTDCYLGIPEIENFGDDLLSLFMEIALAIAGFFYLMFGHNLLTDGITFITVNLIMFVPIMIVSVGVSTIFILSFLQSLVLDLFNTSDFGQIIYDFGLIGAGFVIIAMIPLAILFLMIGLPIGIAITYVIYTLAITMAIIDSNWDKSYFI